MYFGNARYRTVVRSDRSDRTGTNKKIFSSQLERIFFVNVEKFIFEKMFSQTERERMKTLKVSS